MVNLRPLHDRVVIRRIEEQEQVRGGIIIPDTAREKQREGEVVAFGEGKALADGQRRKELMIDVATLTGGRAITAELGIALEGVHVEDLGRAKRAVVDKDSTTLVEGAGKKAEVEARIRQIRAQVEAATSDYDRE